MRRRSLLIMIAPLTLAPAEIRAQGPDTLRVAPILERVRQGAGGAVAASFLTQEDQPRSAEELDALADSLVAIALSYRRGDDPAVVRRAAQEARLALMWSASPERLAERAASRSERGLGPPVPYPRAFEAFVRVFEGSEGPGMKGSALRLMTNLPDTARVITFLAGVATNPYTELAITIEAVRLLASDTGDPGLAHLRRLWETDAIPHPYVREGLSGIAAERGWDREGPPEG